MRKSFPEIIDKIISKDKKTFVILGDIGVHGFRKLFKKYPKNIINISTMEQTMISFAAGLSKGGYTPFIHTISPFVILRALEQIKIGLSYNKLHSNIITVGASNDYSKLGVTHQCFEDVNVLLNYDINIFMPSSDYDFREMLLSNYKNNKINYYRISSKNSITKSKGNEYLSKNKNKIIVIFLGDALSHYEDLINNFKSSCDFYFINQLNNNSKVKFKNYNKIIFVELVFGNILHNLFIKNNSNHNNQQIYTIGPKKSYIDNYGTQDQQFKSLGLDINKVKKHNK